jgi:hypothetical protein
MKKRGFYFPVRLFYSKPGIVRIESALGWVEVPAPEGWESDFDKFLEWQQAIEIGAEAISARYRERTGKRDERLAEDERLLASSINKPAKLRKLASEKRRLKNSKQFRKWLARKRAQRNRPLLNDKVDRSIVEYWPLLYRLKPMDALDFLERKGILKPDSPSRNDPRWYRRRIERLGKELGRLKPRVQQEPPRKPPKGA